MYWKQELYANELYHHGILGMKWGIRRFQPYGVGYEGKTKGRNVGDAKDYGDDASKISKKKSRINKKAVAAVATGAAIAVGTIVVSKYIKSNGTKPIKTIEPTNLKNFDDVMNFLESRRKSPSLNPVEDDFVRRMHKEESKRAKITSDRVKGYQQTLSNMDKINKLRKERGLPEGPKFTMQRLAELDMMEKGILPSNYKSKDWEKEWYRVIGY